MSHVPCAETECQKLMSRAERRYTTTLGAHYCDRLGEALVVNVPTQYVWVLKVCTPLC
ncbi:hypothetical protein PtA15_2A261 [Puccinia triticina]|uniref:Uncharacterized protein n=1 Tax=Puccinia triticina TaxID=208348 RepID=A0ABY7CAJ2_9BASI|nr:uncharacterized protein PtA15_2A261 [Puccinia triticina]WAQ81948.1 hypothetical protein PtA15_2A261 [Puccinia triticina]